MAFDKGGKIEGKIYLFLCQGASLSTTARMAKKSPAAILKRARKYVAAGKLERIARGRYRKVEKGQTLPPLSQFPSLPQPIMIPVKFGAIFAQVGRPKLEYDERGKAYDRNALFECQFGKAKTQLWLKAGFQGATIEEQIGNGQRLLLNIAASLAKKHGIELTLLRFYEGLEWADPSENRSAITAKGANIKKGGKIEVAGAMHKYSDFSHPDQFQINPKHGGEPEKATEHAKYRENLYSGEYERRFEMLMQLLESGAKASKEDRELLREIVSAIGEIKIRMDMEAKKR